MIERGVFSGSLSSMMKMSLCIFCFTLYIGSVISMSDTYGNNPQHEFGAAEGPKVDPLVPFWRLEGDAAATQDLYRLVPDRQSKKGAMWNTEPNQFNNWEVTFKFRIHGVSSVGADGLAFWYAKDPVCCGKFFGYNDQFSGLGVVLDTYDNDNSGDHPLMLALVNDGTKNFVHTHGDDHDHGKNEMEIGNCQFGIRNREYASLVKITYKDSTLTVETAAKEGSPFSQCLTANNIELPPNYYFGFSATTGQLADNHDIYGFAVKNLDSNAGSIDSQRVFSQYDKYTVAEQLSRLQFDVSTALKKDSKSPASASATGLDAIRVNTLTINENLQSVHDIVSQLSNELKSVQQAVNNFPGGAGVGGDDQGSRNELLALQNSIKGLTRSFAGIEGSIRNLEIASKNAEASSFKFNSFGGYGKDVNSSIVWTILTYFLYTVIGLIIIAGVAIIVIVARNRRERQKKFF